MTTDAAYKSLSARYPGLKPFKIRATASGRPVTPPWTSTRRWPLRPMRRLVQVVLAAALILMPLLDVFRIDVPGRFMVILGQPVLLTEFYFLLLATLMFIFFFTAVTLVLGRVWCGWLCPQTIFYETIERVSRWIADRRSPSARALLRTAAGAALAAVAAAAAFFMLAYFVAPADLLAGLRAGRLPLLAWLSLGGLAGAVFLDGAALREKFCIYACPYGMLQSFLTDRDTLRIRFETEHAADCVDCRACSLVCPVHLEPRRKEYQLTCIDCGLCVAACQDVLSRLGRQGVVDFSFGQHAAGAGRRLPVSAKGLAASGVFAACAVVFGLAVLTRAPLELYVFPDASYRLAQTGTAVVARYQVSVANRQRHADAFRVEVEGLPGASAALTPAALSVPAGHEVRALLVLTLPRDQAASGLHRFRVVVSSESGPDVRAQRDATLFVP